MLLPIVIAVAVGLTIGAAWAEFRRPNDVPLGFLETVALALSIYGRAFIAPILGAAVVGALCGCSCNGSKNSNPD